ncbi:adenosylcobinamide amidohydrolase [Xinfangfangia sp. CPCC 101601]|uniref:Adenosylcobinamide amidohydrolase n=1 Tax=Pseudogemmobacter lacusdianii TaxID=3069608 RepID=A0ABU0VVM2_9RHOB|nr:adenosylcobinamide amidohydrolase [Xinfangfangia sp. CPCC 101601]MDQ2065799.1 adenosylcobinamide amidohydrolase [Xinfangfangia sp. CPCC 101601]
MIHVSLERPWLRATLSQPMRLLSHAPHNAGYCTTDEVLWREVRNADLTPDFPVEDWFAAEMRRAPQAVGMITSRDVGSYNEARATVEGITAQCVITLGLSNAEAVGKRLPWHPADFGTINILVATDAALTETAQLEALTIAVQARTAGLMSAGLMLETGLATGTGTDCIALACHPGQTRYAGLHTAVGEAIGACVREGIETAAQAWIAWRDAKRAGRI